MNSLEWINEQIEECEQAIQRLKIGIDENKNYPSLVKCHNEELKKLKLILQTLQQIKIKLEAWKVFNNNVEIEKVERTNPFMQNTYKQYFIKEVSLYESEVIKIKKAKELEVKQNA